VEIFNDERDKYKARLVVEEYAQQYELDYTKVFSLVVRLDNIRIILVTLKWH